MAKGWWHRATTEQRLAQIDAGIELGMTAAQVALNCGRLADRDYTARGRLGSGALVSNFALRHGRRFVGGDNARTKAWQTRRAKTNLRAAYLSGEVVDFWGAR